MNPALPSARPPEHQHSFLDAFVEDVAKKIQKKMKSPGLLCLVPSALFAEECAHRLLERNGSCVGISFHTPSSLFRVLSEECGTPFFSDLPRAAAQAWVGQWVVELCEGKRGKLSNDLREDLAYLRRFPKARAALAQALLQVRLYGCIRTSDLPPTRGGRLLGLFLEPFDEALDRAEMWDPARRLSTGLALLPGWLADKEWVSLIALPAGGKSPEFLAYAACLQGLGAQVFEETGTEILGTGAQLALPKKLPDLEFFTAQGEEAETEEALERIRAWIQKGVRPDRIALSFVSAEPYLRLIEERAEAVGFPLRPTKGVAFRLTALGRGGRNWLRFVLLDGPAEFRGPLLLEPLLPGMGTPAAAALDRIARDQAWLGGLKDLRNLLDEIKNQPEGLEELKKSLNKMVFLWDALNKHQDTASRCSLLEESMERWGLLGEDENNPFAQVLASLPKAQALLPPKCPPFSLEELAQLLEAQLEEQSIPLPQTVQEGVRVLPLQRMGVLDFDHILILGCLRGRWPSKPRINPWLSPKDIEHLGEKFRERFGVLQAKGILPPCPCPPSREEEQERQRLLLLLKRCKGTLCLSYPGVDLRAKPKAPSPWLEELRTAKGDTHSLRPLSAALGDRLSRRGPEPLGFSELEAMTLASFERKDEALRHFDGRFSCIPRQAGEFVAARDRFHPGETPSPFDALGLGPSLRPGQPISVTAFEDLGNCPLRFFFRHILGLRPLPEEPSLDLVSALERGSAVHRILQKVYEKLLAEGLFDQDPLPIDTCLDLGIQEIGHSLRTEADRIMSRQFLRFPRLRQEVLALWGKNLEAQFRLDLEELQKSGARPVALEKKLEAALSFQKLKGEGPQKTPPLLLKGKYDRLDRLPDGRYRILDYKTGTSAKKLPSKDVLQGRKTQLYLYQRLFLESEGTPSQPGDRHPLAALRGVGPKFPVTESRVLPETPLNEKFWDAPLKDDLEDSLATLLELCEEGHFPFESEHGPCRHCEFASACPRHHAPTQDRMEAEPRTASFRSLKIKSPTRKGQKP